MNTVLLLCITSLHYIFFIASPWVTQKQIKFIVSAIANGDSEMNGVYLRVALTGALLNQWYSTR